MNDNITEEKEITMEKVYRASSSLKDRPMFDTLIKWFEQRRAVAVQAITSANSEIVMWRTQGALQELDLTIAALKNADANLRILKDRELAMKSEEGLSI